VEPVPETTELARYLEDTEVVDWMTPAVEARAREVTAACASDAERVRACAAFVRRAVAHPQELPQASGPPTCRASAVLRAGHGLSFAQAHLLVALLRSRGIPAGFVYQRLRRPGTQGGFVVRGLAAARWAEGEGAPRWRMVDPAGPGSPEDPPAIGAPAYRADGDAGEATDPRVVFRPLGAAVRVLEKAPDLESAVRALPSASSSSEEE